MVYQKFSSHFVTEQVAFYIINCKYCSTKSSVQNLHENGVIFLWKNLLLNMNMIVSTSSNENTYVWIEIDQSDGQRFGKEEGK